MSAFGGFFVAAAPDEPVAVVEVGALEHLFVHSGAYEEVDPLR